MSRTMSYAFLRAMIIKRQNRPHPNCAACRGKGYHEAKIRNLGTLDYEWHTVPCDHCSLKVFARLFRLRQFERRNIAAKIITRGVH